MTQKVIVIDDSDDIHKQVKFWLAKENLQVDSLYTADNIIQNILNIKPNIILLDVLMPDYSGFDVCVELKNNDLTKDIPIVFLSGESNAANKVRGLNLGATDYITKPFDQAELCARVRIILQTKTLENSLRQEIQQRQQAEKALKDYQENLQQLVRERTYELELAHDKAILASQAKNEFLAIMSHELKTPLNAIIGYSELIIEEQNNDSECLDDLCKIKHSGMRLFEMIERILHFANTENDNKYILNLAQFNITDLIHKIAIKLQPLIDKNNNHLTLPSIKSSILVTLDEYKIQQVIYDILDNANKFTTNGEINIDITLDQTNNLLQISIIDTGIGIHSDCLDKIFQPFIQVDNSSTRSYEGGGLGLAICQQYLTAMDGNISVTSTPNQGSTFTMTIPIELGNQNSA